MANTILGDLATTSQSAPTASSPLISRISLTFALASPFFMQAASSAWNDRCVAKCYRLQGSA